VLARASGKGTSESHCIKLLLEGRGDIVREYSFKTGEMDFPILKCIVSNYFPHFLLLLSLSNHLQSVGITKLILKYGWKLSLKTNVNLLDTDLKIVFKYLHFLAINSSVNS
jgi:hypothetical protein